MLLSFFFFKQKTAYEMRISDWSSDVCSSDLRGRAGGPPRAPLHDDADRDRPPLPLDHDSRGGAGAAAAAGDRGVAAAEDAVAPVRPALPPAQIGRASWRERVGQ